MLLLGATELCADESAGEQVFQHCKNCHGVEGQGGEAGKYPRIAGLPSYYIRNQLLAFKSRKRLNKPMVPIFKDWRFNQEIIEQVAEYVAGLPLDLSVIPVYQPDAEMLAQFDSREQMLEVGEDIFKDCAQCHGEDAKGIADKESPPLIRQYPNYLRKQIGDFAEGLRQHENSESLFQPLEADELEALLYYLGQLGEQPEEKG